MIMCLFNDTATTEIYTLSLHDALPISQRAAAHPHGARGVDAAHEHAGDGVPDRHPDRGDEQQVHEREDGQDRKSTRLNSSHANISYAVFCFKKKKIPLLDRLAADSFQV